MEDRVYEKGGPVDFFNEPGSRRAEAGRGSQIRRLDPNPIDTASQSG